MASPHRCLDTEGDWVPCPDHLCEADALVADLERVTRERDEARAGDYGMARAPYGEVEVMRERERAERAERQRDQAIEALRTIHTSPICFIDCTERVGAVLATLDPDAAT